MREKLSRERLQALMQSLAESAPRAGRFRVYFVGGATAVHRGWRESTIDADMWSDDDAVFRTIQAIKERLRLNVEFKRPENFVPPLHGASERHVFINTIGNVSFYHYDPYSQLLAKVVRGFEHDLRDAEAFIADGLVDPDVFRSLIEDIPESAFAKYPNLDRSAVLEAIDDFLDSLRR